MAQEIDPYRPPQSQVTSVDDTSPVVVLASKGRRFGTFLVDYICFMAFGFVFGLLIAITLGQEGIAGLHRIPRFVLGSVLVFCYYVFFESVWARTPGKLIFGTFVVDDAGGQPSPGQIIKRTLCRFIPFETFSFLGERGWHDSISNTRVVRGASPNRCVQPALVAQRASLRAACPRAADAIRWAVLRGICRVRCFSFHRGGMP